MTIERRERRAVERRAHLMRLAAYLLMCAIVVIGFWRIEQALNRIDAETHRALAAECEIAVENRRALRAIVEQVGAEEPAIPEGADDALRQALEEDHRRSLVFRDQAMAMLPDVDCADIVPDNGRTPR